MGPRLGLVDTDASGTESAPVPSSSPASNSDIVTPRTPEIFTKIREADVLFAALNLADVGSMQSADMGELFLGPLPGQTTLMDPFAQKFQ
jgi:hypothetical protein